MPNGSPDTDATRVLPAHQRPGHDPDATVIRPRGVTQTQQLSRPDEDSTVILKPRHAAKTVALPTARPTAETRSADSASRSWVPPPLPPGNAVALPLGYQLQEYRIERVLGQGGFGITYLATDTHLNAPVAVKEYLPEDIAFRSSTRSVSPNATKHRDRYRQGLDSFLNEARTLASLKHPSIVQVLRFFEAHDTAYMVLQYVRGSSLKQWWPANSEIGEKKLVQLIEPLLDGLSVVHAAGYLHRDIKPDNIQRRDEDGRLVLLDFGSAGQTIAAGDPGSVVVTPGYAPIEQYGLGEQGPWTDIYAFGATLYWMISGKKPMDAESRWTLPGQADPQLAGARNMPLAQTIGQGRYSDSFLQAIDWALKSDPQDRPRDIAEWSSLLLAAHASSLSLRDALRAGEAQHDGAAPKLGTLRHRQARLRQALRQWHPRAWSLSVTLTLAMMLTALLPMAITAYYNVSGSSEALAASELHSLEQLARSTAARITQLIGDSKNMARGLSADEDFNTLLTNPSDNQRRITQTKLERLVAANPDIHLILVLNRQGTVVSSNLSSQLGRNFAFRDYHQSTLQGQPFVGGIGIGPEDEAAGMPYANPVLDAQGQVIGSVVVRIKGSSFARILDESRADADHVPMLFDGDGVLVHYPDPTWLYRSMMPIPPGRLAEIRNQQRFRGQDIPTLNLSALADAISRTRGMGHVAYDSNITHRPEVAGFAPVIGHNWTVVMREARETFEAPLRKMWMQLLVSGALIGLLFLGLSLRFARSIVRPIRALTLGATALKNGDFDRANVQIARQDEIGSLARTFNVMVDVLRQREAERGRSKL